MEPSQHELISSYFRLANCWNSARQSGLVYNICDYIYYNCSNNVYNIYTYIHIRVYRYMQRHIYIYIYTLYTYIHIYTYTHIHTTMDIQICIYYRHHTHDYSQKLVQHLYVIQTLDIYLLRLACGGRFRRCATLSTSLPTTSTWRFWILG